MTTRVNHLGITVGDIDAAVVFYTQVFGLRLLVAPQTHRLDTPHGARRADVFGPRWRGMKLAHLVNDEGAGFELFEFLEPASLRPPEPFDYWRQGHSHVCLTVEDLDQTLARLVAMGGQQRSQIHQVNPTTRIVYCQDPWGVVIELSNGSYRRIVGQDPG